MVRRQFELLEDRIVLSSTAMLPPDSWFAKASAPALQAVPLAGSATNSATITVGDDTIPRFAANPTVTSVKSGNWTDGSVWSTGRVPRNGERVLVAPGMQINYNTVSNVQLDSIEIGGSLIFKTSANTRLIAANITVMPAGTLQIGTAASPIGAKYEAEIIFADQSIDPTKDPEQYGTGLIGLGTVTIHGATLSHTWQRLAAEPRAGDTSLQLSESVSGWKPGDTLVLPDTRQVRDGWDKLFPAGGVSAQWEEVKIASISGDRAILTKPLQFDHRGAYNSTGGLELLPHVAHLNQNVVIRSQDPSGTRGHVYFIGRANVDIQYARFQDLGRTDAFAEVDDTEFDSSGKVTHFGTNQDGRYSVTFYDLLGPVNPTNTGYQFKFIGNTVDGALRWGVALENASFGLIQGNVVYNAQGAGFVTGEGNEIGNVFADNMALRIVGTHNDGKSGTYEEDYARGGSGFWFRYGGNTVNGNVAADSTYAGFVIDGYDFAPVSIPKFRGADPEQPGQGILTTLNPAAPFDDNEAYGMSTFGLWAAYISGDNLLDNQPTTVFSDLRLWNIWLAGVHEYHTSNTTFQQLLILGDQAAQTRNDAGTIGVDLSLYENRNVVIRNSRIEGVRAGINAPRIDGSQAGRLQPTIIENSFLRNYANIVVSSPQDNRPGNGNAVIVRNVKFALNPNIPSGPAPAASVGPSANIVMYMGGEYPDLTQPSVVYVYNYNQVSGDNFQVFYRQQVANFILPQTKSYYLSGRSDGLIGSPEAGLTNAQNWAKYSIAMAGAIAPGSAASRPGIEGLVAPIQNLSLLTPTVVLITPWDGALVPGIPMRVRYNVNGVIPEGGQVYFSIDGAAPVKRLTDAMTWNMSAGKHTLLVFLGDASGRQLSGTKSARSAFTLVSTAETKSLSRSL